MQTITVHTTQNIDIDYEVAGLGERIVARLIDYGIFIGAGIILLIVSSNLQSDVLGIAIISLFALFCFYDLLCELFMNGQSLGKRVMKIRVISLDGARPTFSQYLLRWLFRIVDFGITAQLGGLLCAVLTQNVQRIGDVVAGTSLIRTQPRTKMEHLSFAPVENTYEPVFKEVIQLNDKDIVLVSEVIHNYFKTGNAVIVFNTAQRLKELLGVIVPSNMNDLLFLQTIVKDYSHLAATQAEAL